MEVILCLSKVKADIQVVDQDFFYLKNAGVFAAVMPPERLSFFYDKLSINNNTERNKYPELFQFLDNLGNVVATNNGSFMKFLDVGSVTEYFRRRYPTANNNASTSNAPASDYCCLTVPALTTFLSSVCSCLEGLTKVLAVGFTRKGDSEELWDFKDSFVVFENSGEISVFYGDNMDTSNTALLEVFDAFASTSGKPDFEKVVNLLSI
uniref:p23 protein n=1 Tax=Grapevine leafroll-associated virus 4 TaxID=70177 RepID=A0A0B5JHE6_9CLOS|nr:23 kDa protein [Grapevine leafroll-associated virus 4]